MSQKRYTKPKFFEQIGRVMMGRLLEKYQTELVGHGVVLPERTLEDKDYYAALSQVATRGPGLPDNFRETLHRVEAMANTVAKGRLLRAAEQAGVQLERIQEATEADFAVQVLLANEALFTEKFNETHIMALSTFEYHASREPMDRRQSFHGVDEAEKGRIKTDIDTWLSEEREGDERVTEIEVHEIEGEFWFLIRHGASSTRLPTVEGGRVVVKYLRPARDLVAVYTPERDEIRVNASSVSERKMIRRVLGQRLFGDPDYFAVRRAFTLQPLRSSGRDALVPSPGKGIERVILRQLEVHTDDEHEAVLKFAAIDWFAYAEANRLAPIPRGRLVSAGFEVFFTGQAKSRMVYLRAGNSLRLTRHCDGPAVHRWLTHCGFRDPEVTPVNRITSLNGLSMERN